MTRRFTTDCEGFHRRDFLRFGAGAGLLGLSLPQLLQLEARAAKSDVTKRKADAVIMVWLAGGPATIDMWDLKPEAPEGIRGEFKPIPTSAKGIMISEHLPKMAKVADKATIVRSIYHTIPSHGTATVWMTTGNKPTPAMAYPALGSLASKLMPATQGVPKFVSFGEMRNGDAGTAGYLGTAYNPFIIDGAAGGKGGSSLRVRGITLPNGFTMKDLQDRDALRSEFENTFRKLDKSSDMADGFDAFHQQALDILRSEKTRDAFNLQKEPEALRERYGANGFGASALAARRLVEAGVRFVTLSTGGWDTHGQNFNALKSRLLPNVDTTLSALIQDLSDRGMLERTVVYCAGEFGRTPKINKNSGRDHWSRSMAVVLAGGGFKKGYAHGTTDAQGMAAANDPCSPDDVSATIFRQLGIDAHTELMTPSNRPMQLFREGRPVEKLLG
jgi:uncharacterized protein (DUF1501 family)